MLRRGSPLRRHRDFLLLWAAQGTSAVGSRLTRTALPVIAILTIEASPFELGVLAALSVAPGAIVGLLAGGAIDRSRKRPILIGADLVRLVLLLTIPAAAWTGALTMAQLFVIAALVGCATTLFQITDNTYLPALVARDDLIDANAALESTEAVAEITGPGLAGVLIELITAPVTILIDAISYAASALLLVRISRAEEPVATDDERPSLAADTAAGGRAVWAEPTIRPLFLGAAATAFWGGFFFALYMLFTLDTLGLSPGEVGLIISVGGVGALFGSALTARISRKLRAGPVLIALLALSQAGSLLIPMARGPTWLVIAFLVGHQLIGDGFRVAYHVLAVSLRQILLPLEVLGRANAFFQVAETALVPLGALAAGGLASFIGVRSAVWVGVVGGMTAPLFLLSLLASSRRLGGQSNG